VQVSRERHYLKYKIWVPNAHDATHTVTFHYLAYNGLRFFEDHDELYWNVTGDEWDVPLEAVSARITLPGTATGVRAIAFNGAYGSTARDAQVTSSGTTIAMEMPRGLGFREGLTAVVGWDKGAVAEPTQVQRAAGFVQANWPLGIPVVVFVAMFLLWYRVGRDPSSLPITVQYEPPGGLTPGEAGTLIDGRVDMRDITATVVNLAVQGRLKIEEKEEPVLLGLFKHKEYIFHKLEPKYGAPALEAHEESVLRGIFDGAREVRMSDLHNDFYENLPDIRDGVYGRLIQRGLYRTRPDRVKAMWMTVAIVVGMASVALKFVAGGNLAPVTLVIAGFATAGIVALFGLIMPARTVLGARTCERVLGFEEFLNRVESERYARVVKTPEMFERFLPYAMAFGVERRWARAFENICHEPPRWYVGAGPGTFNSSVFSSRMSAFATSAGSSMGSSPRSSGGSGFGGGGSSGGGGGGGGGGGF
jgi:uncharacterized membrane protein